MPELGVLVMANEMANGRVLPAEALDEPPIGRQLLCGQRAVLATADVFDADGNPVQANDVTGHERVGYESIDRAVAVDEVLRRHIHRAAARDIGAEGRQLLRLEEPQRGVERRGLRCMDHDHFRHDPERCRARIVVRADVLERQLLTVLPEGDGPIKDGRLREEWGRGYAGGRGDRGEPVVPHVVAAHHTAMSYRRGAESARERRDGVFQRRMRRSVAIAVASLVPAGAWGQARDTISSDRDSSGVLSGVLSGREDGQPIGFATVKLVGRSRGIFADARGAFRIGHLTPGRYRLSVRQIGYAPLDTAVDVATAPATTHVSLHLHRVALHLNAVAVEGHRAKGCVATGVPDSAVSPVLATVFAQVRENVDRLRLLLNEYPFTYSREESRVIARDPGGDSAQHADTASYESSARRPYRIGGIVFYQYDPLGRSARYMYLPTFQELADSAFLSAHCFSYGGTTRIGGDRGPEAIRVDFKPAAAITEPDVEGSIYLDAQRLIVRRAVFRMTRPETADPPVLGLSVTTSFRELVPLVPVFDSVESVQTLPPIEMRRSALPGAASEGGVVRQSAVERDRLLEFEFERRKPGDQARPPSPATTEADSTKGIGN